MKQKFAEEVDNFPHILHDSPDIDDKNKKDAPKDIFLFIIINLRLVSSLLGKVHQFVKLQVHVMFR